MDYKVGISESCSFGILATLLTGVRSLTTGLARLVVTLQYISALGF